LEIKKQIFLKKEACFTVNSLRIGSLAKQLDRLGRKVQTDERPVGKIVGEREEGIPTAATSVHDRKASLEGNLFFK
jgi:hypothetical protein